MDYMKLINRSIKNAWRHKFLWFFGFFVSAGDAGVKTLFQDDDDHGEWLHELGELSELTDFSIDPALIVLIGTIAVAVTILFWITSVLSEGSLIFGIHRKENNVPVTFADCWTLGLQKFFRLFGIMFLAGMAVFASILALAVVVVPGYFVAAPVGIILTILAVPVLLVLILVMICVEGWAIRYAIIEDATWLLAVRRGWNLFTAHVGQSIAVAFSSMFTQIALVCGLVVAGLFLAIPFVLIAMANWQAGLIAGATVGVLALVLSMAYLGTFASSLWTLAYLQLTGKQAAGA